MIWKCGWKIHGFELASLWHCMQSPILLVTESFISITRIVYFTHDCVLFCINQVNPARSNVPYKENSRFIPAQENGNLFFLRSL